MSKSFAAVIASLACALMATTLLAAPCQLQQMGELPIQVQGGAVTVDAHINGQPARMIVDTGSDATVLFRGSLQGLGLTPRRVTNLKFYGVGGGNEAVSAFVKELRVADLVATNQEMVATGSRVLDRAVGLLGSGFLLQADVELDFAHKTIRFLSSKGCAGDQVVYWRSAYSAAPMLATPSTAILVPVLLNGVPIRAQLDTGASASVVTLAGAAKAGMTPKSPGVEPAGATVGMGPDAEKQYLAVFPSFTFGDETIRNAKLLVADLFGADTEVEAGSRLAAPVSTEMPEMLLGADFIRAHRIYIAVRQRKVYLSYVGGAVFDTEQSAAMPSKAP